MTLTTNARLAGSTFLLYIAVGVTQLVLSSGMSSDGPTAERLALIARHVPLARLDVLLTLLIIVIASTLAVALYGLTRDVDRDLAVLALACRLGEALLAAVAPVVSLGLLWLATSGTGPDAPDRAAATTLGAYLFQVQVWNTEVAAILFAVGSTLFCWLLLRGRRIPTPLARLGVVASVLLVAVLPLRLAGFLDGAVVKFLWLPMAAFEIPLGFWLLIKGVRAPAAA